MNSFTTINRPTPFGRAARTLILLQLLVVLITWHRPAQASSPEAVVEEVTQHIYTTLRERRAELQADPAKIRELIDGSIAPLIDFEIMGRMVLGKHWRSATPEQRTRFVAEFRRFLVRFYSSAVTEYIVKKGIPDNVAMEVLPAQQAPSGHTAKVKTRITQPGRPSLAVGYTLYQRDGVWRVVDLQVANISLVINYRQSFANQIRSSGLDGLIANLAAHNENA
jgi:phospholipid transport system substrate-binding protein